MEERRWWVLERVLGTSKREALLNTVLVPRSDLLQVALRSVRWGTGHTCVLCSIVRAVTGPVLQAGAHVQLHGSWQLLAVARVVVVVVVVVAPSSGSVGGAGWR